MTWVPYDEALVDEIAAAMTLRRPNAQALSAVAEAIEAGDGGEYVCDLATGVGKTYLAAALIDYLARSGVRNVLFVTPGSTIQTKTIANFTPGSAKHVPGAEVEPLLITAENFARGQVGDALHDPDQLKLFVFNVQQLINPTANTSRRTRVDDEFIGGALYDHLRAADDLVVIADEHHVYNAKAKAFRSAITELSPRALIGLTATPDVADLEKVIYRYPLAHAIADQLVKIPVIVYRQDGLKDTATQLADAAHLRALKEPTWLEHAARVGSPAIHPVLFVVCQTIADAEKVATDLTAHLPGDGAVLLVTSQSTDDALTALANVEAADSPVRAIVSVDKLKEGWDVRNIAVIVGLRALASETLTEQILGRGLRLPFGARTGIGAIDQVDLVAHESYRELLRNKDSLLERLAVAGPALPEYSFLEPADGGGFRVVPTDPPSGLAPGTADPLAGLGDADILIAASVDDTAAAIEAERAVVGQLMPVVPGRPRIVFPRRDRALRPVQFSLASVSRSELRREGERFRTNQTVSLQGRAIDAERDLLGEVNVVTHAVDSVDATQYMLPASAVRADLIARVLGLDLVPLLLTERLEADEVVDAFLDGAGVTGDATENWTAQRAAQARDAIAALVRSAFARNDRQPSWVWAPQELVLPKPLPPVVRDRYDEYGVRDWYGGWSKSAEHAAQFDSQSAEFALAQLLDDSDTVAWWLRLSRADPVWITLQPVGRYYPDFIVIDDAGVNWLVEAKSDAAAANDTSVATKAAAAEEWAAAVTDDGSFGTWRYRMVTESDIRAANNWAGLVV
jgi:type III restriction enzyme